MFMNILAPVTPSASCERAADAAIALARRFGAAITMLHVHGFEHTWGEAELLALPEEMRSIRSGIEKHYSRKLEGLSRRDIVVDQGVPHVEILRRAREHRADLIVMCPHRKELPRMERIPWTRIGDTTERVISLAHCPVLLVNREFTPGEKMFGSILAPTALTVKDEFGVDCAAQLARAMNARLTVINVLDTDTPEGNAPQEELVRVMRERKERLASEYGGMTRGVAEVDYECVEGQTVVEILKMARTRGADLIVMAHLGGVEDPDCAFELSRVIHVACMALSPVLSVNRHLKVFGDSSSE